MLNKYGAVKQTLDGYSYDSKKEASFAGQLTILQKGGQIESWRRQVKIELTAHGKHVCDYYMDFVVYHNGKLHPKGTIEYVEVKGFETQVWRLKWKLFKAQYGGDHKILITLEK